MANPAAHSVSPDNALRTWVLSLFPWIWLLVPSVLLFRDYVIFDFNLLVALVALPMVVGWKAGKTSWRFQWVATIFLGLHFVLGIKFPLFFGAGFLLLFLAEQQLGRLNWLPVALLCWISPVQVYVSQVLGASLRMQLSEWSAGILQMMGKAVEADGNRFVMDGQVFYVDPACAGLDMLLTTAVFGLLFAGYWEWKMGRRLVLGGVGLLTLWSLGWVIVANLFRIIGIVLLNAAPETLLHEGIGLFSLVLYSLLPTFLGTNWIVKKCARTFERESFKLQGLRKPAWAAVLLSGLLLWGIVWKSQDTAQKTAFPFPQLPGFSLQVKEMGVGGYLGEASIVYVKPPVPFWGADHTPAICWRSEGYQLRGEREGMACGQPVWVAELHKDSTRLYTAWWYDNSETIVHGQWDWRWRTARGERPFQLVNVTVEDEHQLMAEAERVMALLDKEPREEPQFAQHP